ncbi:unnamed protein product [Amoebophrya sp. A120]|nr:unnamed protein product [Amoebophrya sp. A120]|eukprot:GSA120T00015564001.1
MTDEYSPEQVSEVFKVFDPDGEGIRIKDIGTVIRATGLNPPATFVSECVKDANQNSLDTCSFELFMKYVDQAKRLPSELADKGKLNADLDGLKNGIVHFYDKVFPSATKLSSKVDVKMANLAHVLTRLGDKLTEEEMDEFTREIRNSCAIENNRVDWADLKKVVA